MEQRAGATPRWVDSWKSGKLVITLKYLMTVALGNICLRGCCKLWCEAWKINPDRAWLIRSKGNVVLKTLSEWKLGRAAECKLLLKKQEDNCPHKWQRGWLLGYCHLWQYPTTKQVEALLVPHLMAWFKALLAPPCWQMCWRGSPCLPIKEACFWEQRERERTWVCAREWRERESCNGCCHYSSLFLSTHTHVFSHNSLCTLFIFALKYSLLYRHFMVNMEGPIALKHATICGINGATTCLVVGYCH